MGDASWSTCGAGACKSLKRFFDKTLENLSSMKFYVMVIATVMLYLEKLSPEYWLYTMGICIATRNLVELAHVFKEAKLGTTTVVNNATSADPKQPKETTDA